MPCKSLPPVHAILSKELLQQNPQNPQKAHSHHNHCYQKNTGDHTFVPKTVASKGAFARRVAALHQGNYCVLFSRHTVLKTTRGWVRQTDSKNIIATPLTNFFSLFASLVLWLARTTQM